MDCVSRCIDDKDPIGIHQRPRGYGGVAFAWDRKLTHRVKQLPDGNEFILPIVLENHLMDYCIVNVYLPCRGNHTDEEFNYALDLLSTIFDKYKDSYNVIILGDFNASLIDNHNSRDTKFCRWAEAEGLVLPPDYPTESTHYHHRGNGSSTIDYILCLTPDCINNISTVQLSAGNTSSHVPVTALITYSEHIESTQVSSTPRTRHMGGRF